MSTMSTSTMATNVFTTCSRPRHVPAAAMGDPFAQYYPPLWPNMPFHDGEIAMQKAAGVHETVMSYAPKVIRPYMPDQHRDFYRHQPYLAVAARDENGNMWASLLTAQNNRHHRRSIPANDDEQNAAAAMFVTTPDPVTLEFQNAGVSPTDALATSLHAGTDMGILGLEFANRRRNRVNGRIVATDNDRLVFHVDQSFGNCPQYIHPRPWYYWTNDEEKQPEPLELSKPRIAAQNHRANYLNAAQVAQIRAADTVFVATGYRPDDQEDVRYGNDVSHRGGPTGFLHVSDNGQVITLPDFPGNNHYNSLGNLLRDPSMGLSIPDFANGGLLQVTGTASVEHDPAVAAALSPGALRLVHLTVAAVNEVPAGSIPVRWSTNEDATRQPRELVVTRKTAETSDITSFYLRAPFNDGNRALWSFRAGQHLPIAITTATGQVMERTYSLSSRASSSSSHDNRDAAVIEYRISVKRMPHGAASSYLHDRIQVGDKIVVTPPAGDFVVKNDNGSAPIVLMSAGVGITPILCMLHELVAQAEQQGNATRSIFWFHGARTRHDVAFEEEVTDLVTRYRALGGSIHASIFISHLSTNRAPPAESLQYNAGRMTAVTAASILTANDVDPAQVRVYMCGPSPFMAEMSEQLLQHGAQASQLYSEEF